MYAYNPRKKSFHLLEKSMVGSDRWDILHSILKEMDIKKNGGLKQHWMIIGPRGIGKSHLMTLLYYKVKVNRKLSKKWVPILFPEELKLASSLHQILERIIKEIISEINEKESPISAELAQRKDKIKSVPAPERARLFFDLIAWFYAETGKHTLLIAENLQHLLGKKITVLEQKKLRAFLQTSEALLIVGSATTVFNALHDHSHPFYHFFYNRRLEELKFEDMRTLLVNILSQRQQPELTRKVTDGKARLKALYSFTGGNPRMAVFLADILSAEVPGEMLELMDRILDGLTPYFESILQGIADCFEEVINTLAAFEPAQSPREIAKHLEMPQASIRNYLKQLKDDGYVRIAFSKGKSNYYCLSEYLYRTWYQMRDNSHREESRWLIELLLMLFSREYIAREQSRLETCLDAEPGILHYKKLIDQAVQYIDQNPFYCEVIERCMDLSTVNDKKDTRMQKEVLKLIKEAIGYTNKQQYEIAIEKCKKILEINPKSERTYILWGLCLRAQGRYEEGIEKCKKVLEINPKSEGGYRLWGECLREQGRYEEAIEKIKKVLELNPKSVAAYGIWGKCLREQDRYHEAIEKCKIILKINPKSESAYWLFGDCLRKQRQYKQAIEKFKEVININPKSFSAFGAWGDCLKSLGLYNEAEKQYQKAIEINENYKDAHLALADNLFIQGHYQKTIDICRELIDINQNSEEGYLLWGACLFKQKDYGEAIEKFKNIVELNPVSEEAYGAWGDSLKAMERYEEAIEKFKKVIELKPKWEFAYGTWGECLMALKRYKEAAEKFKRAIELNPKSERDYLSWGDCLRVEERPDEAIEKFKKAIALNKDSATGYLGWGKCLQCQNHYNDAIDKFKKAIELNPNYDEAYGAWGACLLKLGRNEEALKLIETNVKVSKNCSTIRSYANCLMQAKRYQDASEQFEKLIAMKPDCPSVYEHYSKLLEKSKDKVGVLSAKLSQFKLIFEDPEFDYGIQEIFIEDIAPLVSKLKPSKYLEQFYEAGKRNSPRLKLLILLILLAQYDIIREHAREIFGPYLDKKGKEKRELELFIFTIKLSAWLKLIGQNFNDALKSTELYIEYIKTLKTTKEKEERVLNFSLDLLTLQIKYNIKGENVRNLLDRIGEEKEIPFSNVIFKVWICLSEPDSVEAQRYLNEKPIAVVVEQLKQRVKPRKSTQKHNKSTRKSQGRSNKKRGMDNKPECC